MIMRFCADNEEGDIFKEERGEVREEPVVGRRLPSSKQQARKRGQLSGGREEEVGRREVLSQIEYL